MSPRPKKHHRAHNLSILLLAAVALLIVAFFASNQSNIRSQASPIPSIGDFSGQCYIKGDMCVISGGYIWPYYQQQSQIGSCQANTRASCESPSTNSNSTAEERARFENWKIAQKECSVDIRNQDRCLDTPGCHWNSAGQHCELPSCNEFISRGESACNNNFVTLDNGSTAQVCVYREIPLSPESLSCKSDKNVVQPKNCLQAGLFGFNFCSILHCTNRTHASVGFKCIS